MHIWSTNAFQSVNDSLYFQFVNYKIKLLKSGDLNTCKYSRSEKESKRGK